MVQTGLGLNNIKSWAYHVVFVIVLQLIAKLVIGSSLYGFILGMGILFGRELSQVEYRALAEKGTWDKIRFGDYFKLRYWKAKSGGLLDTVLDIFLPFLIGGILCLIIK